MHDNSDDSSATPDSSATCQPHEAHVEQPEAPVLDGKGESCTCGHGEECKCSETGGHTCSCKTHDQGGEKSAAPVPLDSKDIKHLKRSGYEKAHLKFKKSFVIRNLKNGKVVEMRAATVVHACNMIGWRPRHVQLLAERGVVDPRDQQPEEAQKVPETGREQADAK